MMKLNEAIDYLQPIADNAELSGYSEALGVAMEALREVLDRESAQEINRAALSTYGAERQVRKCLEEMNELGTAVSHCFDGKDKPSHVAEEIADVRIMLDQMAVLFDCEAEVERQKRYKLRRLEQRIEEARNARQT